VEDDSDSNDEQYAGPVRQAAGALENDVLAQRLPGYVDAWPTVHGPLELGHTFDGARNPHVRDPEEQMRYDRVMTRGATPLSITLLGTAVDRASGDGGESTSTNDCESHYASVVPSDHYGLCAHVELSHRSTT